jgi:hypothetical protein
MDLTMMVRVGDRWEKMEGSCSTGQSPQWAVVQVEEAEEEEEEEEEEKEEEEYSIRWNNLEIRPNQRLRSERKLEISVPIKIS